MEELIENHLIIYLLVLAQKRGLERITIYEISLNDERRDYQQDLSQERVCFSFEKSWQIHWKNSFQDELEFKVLFDTTLQLNAKLKEELRRLQGNNNGHYSIEFGIDSFYFQKKNLELILHGHAKFVHISTNPTSEPVEMYVKYAKDQVHWNVVRSSRSSSFSSIHSILHFRCIDQLIAWNHPCKNSSILFSVLSLILFETRTSLSCFFALQVNLFIYLSKKKRSLLDYPCLFRLFLFSFYSW